MAQNQRGLSYVELTISIVVLAIVGVLACPRLFEWRTRSKVSRVRSDMRKITAAVEALQADYGLLPVDFWDDDHALGRVRSRDAFSLPLRENQRRGTVHVLAPLTTPILYLAFVPADPFAPHRAGYLADGQDRLEPRSYFYGDEDPHIPGADDGGMQLLEEQFVLLSPGPDGKCGALDSGRLEWYDPSNGTTSGGDIVGGNWRRFEKASDREGETKDESEGTSEGAKIIEAAPPTE